MHPDIERFVVDTSTSLLDAMNQIDNAETGMVLVVEDGELIGTATDGDIRRGLLSGLGVESSVEEIMNDSPIVLGKGWSAHKCEQYLQKVNIGEKIPAHRLLLVPVTDDDGRVENVVYVNHDGEVTEAIAGDSSLTATTEGTAHHRPNGTVNSVLVIGGAGYIGSVLCRQLLESGYRVRVLDNLTYGDHGIESLYDHDRFSILEGDMRSIPAIVTAIEGMDAVVHLGALVGDPASSIDTKRTLETNLHAVRLAASICKYYQINRFIFASTCSVYGTSDSSRLLRETAPTNPASLYAKSKLESEKAILELEDRNFSPTVFRMATVYGLSPRMRFDLVVNILSAKAATEGKIPINGGDQYRPLVHVRDVARAYIDCLEKPIDIVSGEIYNVGSTSENYSVNEVGDIIASCFPKAEIEHRPEQVDERTYRVEFSKVRDEIGFIPELTVEDGAIEIKESFETGNFEDYTESQYSNYKSLKGLERSIDSLDAPSRTSTD